MSFRIPIRFITVFSVTDLMALTVGIVIFLGLVSATQMAIVCNSRIANCTGRGFAYERCTFKQSSLLGSFVLI